MKYTMIRSIQNTESLTKSVQKYRFRLAVVLLIIQWLFKRFHFRYRHLIVLTEVVFLTCRYILMGEVNVEEGRLYGAG